MSATQGDTPQSFTFSNAPTRDDVFINTADALSWIYADDDGSGSPGWVRIEAGEPPERPFVIWSSAPDVAPPTGNLYRLEGGRPLFVDTMVGTSEIDAWIANDATHKFHSSPLAVVANVLSPGGVTSGGEITVYQENPGGSQIGTGPRTGTTTVYDVVPGQAIPGVGGVIYEMHSWDEGLGLGTAYGVLNPKGTVSVVRVDQQGGRTSIAVVPHGSPPGTAPIHEIPLDQATIDAVTQTRALTVQRDDVFISEADGTAFVYDGHRWVALPPGLPPGGNPGDTVVKTGTGVQWTPSDRPAVTVVDVAGDNPGTRAQAGGSPVTWDANASTALEQAAVEDAWLVVSGTASSVHVEVKFRNAAGTGGYGVHPVGTIGGALAAAIDAAVQAGNTEGTLIAPSDLAQLATGHAAASVDALGHIIVAVGGTPVQQQDMGVAPAGLAHSLASAFFGKRDDVFINTQDDKTWIYADDDGNGTPGWVRIGGAKVTTSSNPSATPTTVTPALPTPDAGDVFINTNDQMTWIYDGENSQWLPLSSAAVSGFNLMGIIAAPNPDYEIGTWELAAGGNLANGKFTISQLSPGDLTIMPYDAGGANHEVDILNMNIGPGDKIVMQSLTDPNVRILCDVQSVAVRAGGASNAFVFNGHIETSWQSGQSVAAPPSTMRFGLEKYEPHQTAWADLAYELQHGQLTPGGYLMVDHIRPTGNPALPGIPAATPMNIGDWLVALDSDDDGTVDRFHLVKHDKPPVPGLTIGEIKMWPTTTPPADHLICDGSRFNAATYPELRQVLGTDVLPDMRDRFVRGYNPTGNKGGIKTVHEWLTARARNAFRTARQPDHRHTGWYRDPSTSTNGAVFRGTGGGGYFGWETVNTEPAGAHDHYINSGGDAETRPDNIILAFIIQAR